MTDTHCHLDYCDDSEAAVDPHLMAIVSVGTTVMRCQKTLALAEAHKNVWAAIGIHPNDATQAEEAEARAQIEAMLAHPKAVAVGETGFDFYWDRVAPEVQERSFLWQLSLAAKFDKPVILHVRDKAGESGASLAAARVLKEVGWGKGILHCFNGNETLLEVGLALGWLVSFAGNLSYKNAKELHEAARSLPQERLLVETDSPFLSPQPRRGKPNRPAYVRFTAQALADLRGETLNEAETYTDTNAARVYGF